MTKNLFKLLRNYVYLLLVRLIKIPHAPKKYNATICAIFKNEGRYLQEWIEYHHLMGIDHFYLYNNFSSDNYLEVLQPYINAGIVTLTDWPHERGQISAYNHCLNTNKDETSWIGFIDLDEFIVPNKFNNIPDWLAQHRHKPMAFMYWKFFSSGGHLSETPSLVTEKYTIASPLNNTQKMFFNTSWYKWVKNFHIAHIIKLKYFGTFVPDYPLIYYRFCQNKQDADIQLNHYYSKSYEYQLRKKIPNGDVYKNRSYDFEQFYYIEKQCRWADYNIFPYLIKLKLALSKDNKKD